MRAKKTPPAPKKPARRIGTENESSLHRALKFRYSGKRGETETVAQGFICDARTENGEFIEVQTGSFAPLKDKVRALAQVGRVRIVHPVAVQKRFEIYDTDGNLIHQGKTPGKKGVWHLFAALLYAPELPLLPRVTIEVVLVDVLERRVDDGRGSWRRKGVSIADKTLAGWHESIVLSKPRDYFRFVPFKKKESFTVKALAEKAGINAVLARKCLYVLLKMGLVERLGKESRSYLYTTCRDLPSRRGVKR